MSNDLLENRIFVRTAMQGGLPEFAKYSHFTKIRIYNISYKNINMQESEVNLTTRQNSYFIASLIELTTEDGTVFDIVCEDVFVIQNKGRMLVSFFDNYEIISKEKVYESYQKVTHEFRKGAGNANSSRKLTNEFLKEYRDEITKGYRELFNFYKLRNREFNQNTLENRRYMRIRKRLSRNILKELLISKIIVEYRSSKIFS